MICLAVIFATSGPNIYGSPKSTLHCAIQNKFQWYKKLKQENIKQYWSHYIHLNNLQDKQVETKKEKEFNKLDSGSDIESKEEEEGEEDKGEKISLDLAPFSPAK